MLRKNQSNLKKYLSLFLISIILFNLISIILAQNKYFRFDYWTRFPELKKSYYDSQYATKNPSRGWISDALAYTYAGGELIQGTNPVLVIPDAPPLGKYLIGISAVTFNNEHIITVIFACASLILMYLISSQIFKEKYLALIPPALWSFEPLFKDQLISGPLFDIFQLVFLLLMLYFFNKGYTNIQFTKSVKYFALSFFFLGLFISTKYFISGLIMIAAGSAVLILKKSVHKLIYFLALLPIAIIILLLTYIRVFAFGYEVNEFLGIQKWIFLYHQSQFILPFSIWPLITFNKWYVWFGNDPVISDANWTIIWPIITAISIATIILYLFKKIKRHSAIEILLSWTFFFFLFFSFGQIFSRYLVAVIPIMYIISTYAISEFVIMYISRKK